MITSLDHSEFLGPIAIGRVFSGSIKVGDQLMMCKDDKVSKPKVTKLFVFVGLDKIEVQDAILAILLL